MIVWPPRPVRRERVGVRVFERQTEDRSREGTKLAKAEAKKIATWPSVTSVDILRVFCRAYRAYAVDIESS